MASAKAHQFSSPYGRELGGYTSNLHLKDCKRWEEIWKLPFLWTLRLVIDTEQSVRQPFKQKNGTVFY